MQKRVFLHIAFWVAYVFFKSYLNYNPMAKSYMAYPAFWGFMIAVAVQIVYLLAKIPLVYALFYIVQQYLARQWKLTFSLFALLGAYIYGIFAFIVLSYWVVEQWIFNNDIAFEISLQSVIYYFFILSFTCGTALAIKLIRLNIREKEAEQERIKERLETELRFLKAQTNPHFLFNTLNNIYALARKKSDHTADVVMRLSKLLRFMLYETNKPFIPISDEVKMIENYIELERIRYNDRLKISYTTAIENADAAIAPLILLPFVENAFKHGTSETMYESFISIDLRLNKEALCFCVENAKSEDHTADNVEKIGLNNVRRQLELLYPNHQLTIENNASTYKITLQLNVSNHAEI